MEIPSKKFDGFFIKNLVFLDDDINSKTGLKLF